MRFTELPRPALVGLALLLAVVATLYGVLWMYYVRQEPRALLGIEFDFSPRARALQVNSIVNGSAAGRAGIRAGDRIVRVNGRLLDTPSPFYDAVVRGRPDDPVELTVQRPGEPTPIVLHAVLTPRRALDEPPAWTEWLARELVGSYPVLFLAVGLPVLFLRLGDRNAWLLALLFTTFIAGAPLLTLEPLIHPALRGFALFYSIVGTGLGAALFYWFFAVFPEPSPLDRRLPKLKWVLLAGAALVTFPIGVGDLVVGSSQPGLAMMEWLGGGARPAIFAYFFLSFGVGLVSLVWNGLRALSPEARRKLRVIVWGTLVGLLPFLSVVAASLVAGKPYYQFPFWVWAPTVLFTFLLPLSMAYAVVQHRVLEVPVLLKRSARYLLVQRGFMLLMLVLMVAVTVRLASASSATLGLQSSVAAPVGILLGSALGILLAVGMTEVGKKVTERIDRAFFRSAYDARQILEDLAEKTRTATSREELATLLRQKIREALYPKTRYVYLEDRDGRLSAFSSDVPDEIATLPGNWPLLAELARDNRPREVLPEEERYRQLWEGSFRRLDFLLDEMSRLAPLEPECLVPLVGRDARLVGLLVLGPRMSEEPYSGEDHRLLASVATHAATALEGIRLAEEIAERIESQRKTTHEIEIAQQVQRRLLPQRQPKLETLEYVGQCIQARAVGGDYYDYLDFGPGRVGLVLADIAGKGISAALLMANLQANLRSQYALASGMYAPLEDIPRMLRSVNRLFCENTEPAHYATAFFAVYDDAQRRLRYENCGHNNPLLLRTDGRTERLKGSATVLGMFEQWECGVSETCLQPGDLLVIYSDGVSEAQSDAGEFFGEERLLETIRAHRHLPVGELINTLATTVVTFSGREQEDDITLVVARCR